MSHPDPKRRPPPRRATQSYPSADEPTARTDLSKLFSEVSETQERPPTVALPGGAAQNGGLERRGIRPRAHTHAGLGPPSSESDEPEPPTPSIAVTAAQMAAARDVDQHEEADGAAPKQAPATANQGEAPMPARPQVPNDVVGEQHASPLQRLAVPDAQSPRPGAPSLQPSAPSLQPSGQSLRPMSLRPGAHPSLPPRARGASLAYLLGVALLSAVVASGVAVAAVLLAGPSLMRALYSESVEEAALAPPTASVAAGALDDPLGVDVEIPLVDRARAGDVAALRELEQRAPDKRSIAEALALAAGRTARKRAALGELRAALERDPKAGDNPETILLLREQSRDKEVAPDALAVMASLQGPVSADLIYDVWVSDPFRTETTRLAEELAYTEELRKKASPALSVALDLRRADTCDQIAEVLPRAAQQADQRSLHLLARLLKRRKCGLADDRECYRCLKRHAAAVHRVLKVARRRPAPKW